MVCTTCHRFFKRSKLTLRRFRFRLSAPTNAENAEIFPFWPNLSSSVVLSPCLFVSKPTKSPQDGVYLTVTAVALLYPVTSMWNKVSWILIACSLHVSINHCNSSSPSDLRCLFLCQSTVNQTWEWIINLFWGTITAINYQGVQLVYS